MTEPPAQAAASSGHELPHWDMTPVFSALQSPAFVTAFEQVVAGIAELRDLFDARGVRQTATSDVDERMVSHFDEVTHRFNRLADDVRTVYAYVTSFITTNARDDVAQSRHSELALAAGARSCVPAAQGGAGRASSDERTRGGSGREPLPLRGRRVGQTAR
jgi:hypothetical protein